jgi:aspirochlorine biosynthesis cytochrome P450 monooxygenase
MSIKELQEICNALILGSSETNESALSGAIYYLLKYPSIIDKLNNEIRSTFQKEAEIDLVSTNRLTY